MRVLGIDPGYAIVGWGVVEYEGNRLAPIGYGAVLTEKDTPFEQRLAEIYDSVLDICQRYQPEALDEVLVDNPNLDKPGTGATN